MGIKWSAVRVSEAMDLVEGFVKQAAEPLESARLAATEAKKIDQLPEYMKDRISRLLFAIERIDAVKGAIKTVRETIPDGAIEAERAQTKNGVTPALI